MNSGLLFERKAIKDGSGLPLITLQGRYLPMFLESGKIRHLSNFKHYLEPFKVKLFYTDDWGAYERNIDKDKHQIGKTNTQKIERKNLNFRTRIKRLTRRTILFFKN